MEKNDILKAKSKVVFLWKGKNIILLLVNWEYPGREMEELCVLYLRDGGKSRKMVCGKDSLFLEK